MGDPLLSTPRILWAAMLMAQGTFVALLVSPGVLQLPTTAPDPALLYAFAAAAVAVAVASFAVPAMLHRANASRAHVDVMPQLDASAAPAAYREASPTRNAFANPAAARQQAYAAAFAPFILSVALSEAVSILGFVLGVLGHSTIAWAPFIACGLMLSAWRFPTEARFLGPLARAHGVVL